MLVPLRDGHRRCGPADLVVGDAGDLETVARQLAGRRATLLVVEDPALPSVRSHYPSPFLGRAGAQDIVLGWLRLDRARLAAYAHRASALLQRHRDDPQPLVLLAPRERRYLGLLDELERVAGNAPRLRTLRWSADRIRRGNMLDGLRLGAAAVLFAGHGTRGGWFAYGGISAAAFATGGDWSDAQSTALMFSLSCGTGDAGTPASPLRAGFADEVIALGVAGSILAPAGEPLHADNRALAASLVRTLGKGQRRLDDVLRAVRSDAIPLHGYAAIGDPALEATAAPGATRRGERVFAPAPDGELVISSRHAWA
jgi:hypothetical protein